MVPPADGVTKSAAVGDGGPAVGSRQAGHSPLAEKGGGDTRLDCFDCQEAVVVEWLKLDGESACGERRTGSVRK